MNCHDFEAVAGDLGRESLMDAAQREKALAHSASCASCASRLEDERALTGGLRFIAKAASEEAPARVEAALLTAFRQQREASPIAARPARTRTQRWVYAAVSVAAISLIAALLALAAISARDAQRPTPQMAGNPPTPPPDQASPASPEPEASPHSEKEEVAVRATERRRKNADRIRGAGGRSKPHADSEKPEAAEIATDFIPLVNRGTLADMDGGQVMRVELPRRALMSFGLPMDMERATERIKADVVVGNDGLARAIRFVR